MARRYGADIRFVGMAGLDSEGPMRDFVDRFDLGSFPHAIDTDGELWSRFGVPYQPAWVFIDSRGNLVRHVGALEEVELRGILDDLARDRLPS